MTAPELELSTMNGSCEDCQNRKRARSDTDNGDTIPVRVLEKGYEQGHEDPKTVITGLCRHFFNLGWATGTGGGISIREEGKVYLAPSGVQKERIHPEDIFVLDEKTYEVIETPKNSALKISACRPLFNLAFTLRDAGACVHSHSPNAVMATLMFEKEFNITHIEMIKGINGHGYKDHLIIPIIENTPYEEELEDSMREAMIKYPDSPAVLVQRHGVYVWGRDWIQAKAQIECLDYLFEIAVKMKHLGIDPSKAPITAN